MTRAGLRGQLTRAHGLGRRAAWPLGSIDAVRSGARLVLTYDDGPEPGGTDAVLTALADAGVSATFFVLLTRVRAYPSLFADILAGGHEVGLHGTDHRALPSLTAAEVRERCRDGRAELEDRAGVAVRWLRPPYGRLRLSDWRAARAAGLMPVLWGPSTHDTTSGSVADKLAHAREGIVAGAVLLSHDGFATAMDGVDDGPAPDVDRGRLAGQVIASARERGLTPCSLGSALAAGRARRSAVFTG